MLPPKSKKPGEKKTMHDLSPKQQRDFDTVGKWMPEYGGNPKARGRILSSPPKPNKPRRTKA
jgi:hypothetical protein